MITLGPKKDPDAPTCWCLANRVVSKTDWGLAGPTWREYFRTLCARNVEPGVLAYDDCEVAGWAAVAPRAELTFARSKKFPHMDDLPVLAVWWSSLVADFGWFDQSHFIRDFKRHVGVTPSEYVDAQRRTFAPGEAGPGFVPRREVRTRLPAPGLKRLGDARREGEPPRGPHADEETAMVDPNAAIATQLRNIEESTGRTVAQWADVIVATSLGKHGLIVTYLTAEHGLTHGNANMLAHQVRQLAAGGAPSDAELLDAQYGGAKAALRPRKQFALVEAKSAKRVQLGLNLRDVAPTARFRGMTGMCTHAADLADAGDVDDEIAGWLRAAYDQAG